MTRVYHVMIGRYFIRSMENIEYKQSLVVKKCRVLLLHWHKGIAEQIEDAGAIASVIKIASRLRGQKSRRVVETVT